jgi:hypothetical protein
MRVSQTTEGDPLNEIIALEKLSFLLQRISERSSCRRVHTGTFMDNAQCSYSRTEG